MSARIDRLVTRGLPAEMWLPGITGAVRRVSSIHVMDALCRWRKGGGVDVSLAMRERVLQAMPAALVDLRARKQARAIHKAVSARLRDILWKLDHGGCSRPMTGTLRDVAERAGLNYQTLANFRASEKPMSEARLKRLKRAMRELGLLRKKTLRGGDSETGSLGDTLKREQQTFET